MTLEPQQLLTMYRQMATIRAFDQRAVEEFHAGNIPGVVHAYIGQEAIAAGCMTATRPDDKFITAYRDHGLAIAKGISVNSCMAELYGKATGCAKGKGGSMHFFGKNENFYGGHGIVGAQIGTGAGLAFAENYRGTDNVVLTFFGDGAARQGTTRPQVAGPRGLGAAVRGGRGVCGRPARSDRVRR